MKSKRNERTDTPTRSIISRTAAIRSTTDNDYGYGLGCGKLKTDYKLDLHGQKRGFSLDLAQLSHRSIKSKYPILTFMIVKPVLAGAMDRQIVKTGPRILQIEI